MTKQSETWATVRAAAATVQRSERTIFRWVEAGFVRSMKARGLVLVRRADVIATERSIFDGEVPTKHE
ncbi:MULTISPECIES: hypothetical protein [unclassified Cryobacterium]|uniref:hypothetical protein n=1 Tax=unclassified Cryobacterium TaxID=2649013 RepID=UPI002AB375B9|nr:MULTISPECIES: hypothetical protein [unclassified Cryobacterium]MDY7542618.1 hypothetical protein [Cryobacterium sp. 5B3]MEB0264738.1 hypothetical protein [Cryobacterium sp. 10I5]MEB0273710.1 hypothetical protein [Cryobacterium sp. 5B3]